MVPPGCASNWTIDQTAESYTFDNSLHFALNLGNRRNYLCPRSVDTYRSLIREDRAAAAVFAEVTDALIKELQIEIKRQRLDSTHVLSDMASFGRTKLLGIASNASSPPCCAISAKPIKPYPQNSSSATAPPPASSLAKPP